MPLRHPLRYAYGLMMGFPLARIPILHTGYVSRTSYIQVMFQTYLTLMIVSFTSYVNCDTRFTYCFTRITLPHLLRTSVVYKPCTLVG
jgi:hypothetical protein